MKHLIGGSVSLFLLFLSSLLPAQAQDTGYKKYMDAADQSYQSAKYDLSIRYYKAALQINPKSASAYQGLGNCYYRLSEIPDALKAFDQSLALRPDNPKLVEFTKALRAKDSAEPEMASAEDKQEIDNQIDDIEQVLFKPNWTEQLGLSYSSQPSQTGKGQITSELDFTASDHLTESGHYFSLGGGAGSQKVEGTQTKYGKLTVEGGLGLGSFLPSLNLQLERGQTALNSNALTANLNFQVFEPLTVGMSFGGTLESHDGPESAVGGNSVTIIQIDDIDYSSSAIVAYNPWDILGFTLTAEQEYDDTYAIQGLHSKIKEPINESDQINSISLEADWTFLKNFELQVTGQSGYENLPAGTVYSKVQAETITLTQPTSENFTGYTFDLLYNFD